MHISMYTEGSPLSRTEGGSSLMNTTAQAVALLFLAGPYFVGFCFAMAKAKFRLALRIRGMEVVFTSRCIPSTKA
jgi:hypothetical protein